MNRGNRIYYDALTGIIIYSTGQASGVEEDHPVNQSISYIDIPFDEIDYSRSYIERVDISANTIVVKNFEIPETLEQRRIRELEEDVLLLQIENEVGGIL